MWSITVLINTSTWNEFKHNWKLICLVFLQLHLGNEHANRQHQDALLDKINKIKSDTNTIDGIKASETADEENENGFYQQDPYDFDDDDDINITRSERSYSQSRKRKVHFVEAISADFHELKKSIARSK